MGVAFVSRVAKNFQDYYVNVIVQRVGAEMYSDGIRHSLELPYSVFEDQRSGETLGKLQKVRSDVEKFISLSINLIFTTLVGVVFVIIYAFSVHWVIVPAFLATVPLLGTLSWALSGRIKNIQKVIVAETTALAGSTTESLRNIELVKSLACRSGSGPAQRDDGEDPQARAEEGEAHPEPELHPGHVREPAAHADPVHDAT
jgi:ATP-binding cassette subfamily B protein